MVNYGRVEVALHGPSAALESAIAAQDVRPALVRSVPSLFGPSVWERRDADWIWLLDGTALPRPDALRRLLEAADTARGLPSPALLASKVVLADGALDPGQAPWYRRGGETDLAMLAARRALLPVRAARAGSLLVRRDAGAATGPRRAALSGPGAAMEWTGRLLRDRMGYLVPASVADAVHPAEWSTQAVGRGPLEDLLVATTMFAGSGWRPREKLWLAWEAAGRAGAALRERTAGAARR